MKFEHNARVITCILPAGCAHPVQEKLFHEKNIVRSGIYHARGVGGSGSHRNSFVEITEKDVLVAVVSAGRGKEIFEYLYEIAEIYKPHRGFIYVQKLSKASIYDLHGM